MIKLGKDIVNGNSELQISLYNWYYHACAVLGKYRTQHIKAVARGRQAEALASVFFAFLWLIFIINTLNT